MSTAFWQQRLGERGISNATILKFEIQPGKAGWTYPVPGSQVRCRWKNYHSDVSPKYRWIPSKPDHARYYYPPTLEAAIRRTEGVLWIAGGEPDIWALHSAGIMNALCWFGEMAIPRTLADDLRRLGVREVHLAPDRDETGLRAATKIRGLLASADIRLLIHDLPPELGPGGDLGSAWVRHEDPTTFRQWLHGLPPLTSLEEQSGSVSLQQPISVRPSETSGSILPAQFVADIEQALGVRSYKSNGFAQQRVHCPFHDDERPSANWHHEKAFLHCFACGENYLAIQVGDALGIDIRDYQPTKPMPPRLHPLRHTSGPCLSVRARKALLAHKELVGVARVLDALYVVGGWQDGHIFAPKAALAICKRAGISKNSVYQALRVKLGRNLQELLITQDENADPGIFSPVFAPIDNNNNVYGVKNEGKNRRGRPSRHLTLPPRISVHPVLNVFPLRPEFLQIPTKDLSSPKAYRIAFLHLLIKHSPGAYTRKTMGDSLGVSSTTVRAYDDPAALNVHPRIKRRKLSERDYGNYTDDRDDKPGNEWIEDANGKCYPPTRDGFKRAQIVSGGRPFRQCIQMANHYHVKSAVIESGDDMFITLLNESISTLGDIAAD